MSIVVIGIGTTSTLRKSVPKNDNNVTQSENSNVPSNQNTLSNASQAGLDSERTRKGGVGSKRKNAPNQIGSKPLFQRKTGTGNGNGKKLAAKKNKNKLRKEKNRANAEIANKERLLGEAVVDGDTESVEWALRNGASPNIEIGPGGEEGKWSLLYHAVLFDFKAIVALLINSGADVDHGRNGETPLFVAIEKGQRDVVKLLIDRGADVNRVNPLGSTVLWCAAMKGDVDVVRILLRAGADTGVILSYGATARDDAMSVGQDKGLAAIDGVIAAIENHVSRALLLNLCVGLFAMDLPAPVLLAIHEAQCLASGVSQGTTQFVSTRSLVARIVHGAGFMHTQALKTANKVMAEVVRDLDGAPINSLSVTARVLHAKIERDLDKLMCSVCSNAPDDIQMCEVCSDVRYCGAVCQKKSWKQHKFVCKMIAARLLQE